MRRTAILGLAIALASGIAFAGDYHFGENLICSDCHVMHAQISHGYTGQNVVTTYTPTHFLLKGPVNDTCLSCHDNDAAPDVFGNDALGTANRPAGPLNEDGLVIDGTYQDWMGHSLGSTAVAPGGTFAASAPDGLSCTNCHNQHGRATGTDVAGNAVTNAYRNLNAFDGVNVSYAIESNGGNDLTKDVVERFPADYEEIGIRLNEPNTADSGFASWCAGCHGNFHGAVGGPEVGGVGTPPEEFVRHPNAAVNIGELGRGHSSLSVFSGHPYRVRVMSATGDWGPIGAAWDVSAGDPLVTPTCLSCHKAHGNARPFGLIYADGTGTPAEGVGEDGNGTGARDLCKQCHVQGG